jgi:phage pi2 protein 07
MKTLLGINFLHTHPTLERVMGISDDHVILDKDEYETILEYVRKDINFVQWLDEKYNYEKDKNKVRK